MMKDFMKSTYGEEKLSKENELNESMTIETGNSADEYTRKIKNINGGNE